MHSRYISLSQQGAHNLSWGALPTCLLVEVVAEPYVLAGSPGQVARLLPYLTSVFYGGKARHVLAPVQGNITLPIRSDIAQATPRPVRQMTTYAASDPEHGAVGGGDRCRVDSSYP